MAKARKSSLPRSSRQRKPKVTPSSLKKTPIEKQRNITTVRTFTDEERAAAKEKFCELVATNVLSINRILEENQDLPRMKTLFTWFRLDPEFEQQYLRAKEFQAELMSEETLDISDDSSRDYKDGEFNREHVARSKLRVDARQWLASHLKPKRFGSKNTTTLTDPDGKNPFRSLGDTLKEELLKK